MNGKDNGGSAFPGKKLVRHEVRYEDGRGNVTVDITEDVPGMTLRDYFAGQALAVFCATHNSTGDWQWSVAEATKKAYEVADAMLAERKEVRLEG